MSNYALGSIVCNAVPLPNLWGYWPQLADFGLSRVLDTDRTHVSTQTYGTLAYQPAELLQEGKLTKAVDVHSFSMIMYEMYTRKRTFDGCNTGQVSLCKFLRCHLRAWSA